MIHKLLNYIKHPQHILLWLDRKRIITLNDRLYLKLLYKKEIGKKLNLANPKTFNEKMQWLKLNDRNPKYTNLADKYEVKKRVSEIVGEEYVIPTIGIYDSFDEIDFESLPNQFVMKCTHDSGSTIVCKDKEKFNKEEAKNKLEKAFKRNYFYGNREWPYKNIKPRIIIEKYIEDKELDDLRDYKFMCFNGKPKYVYVTVKNDNIWENYYDIDFKPGMINHGFPRYEKEFEKPENFEKMVEIAEKLCKDIPFIRIDLHNINGQIYFGEYTFYDWAGLRNFESIEMDNKFGELVKLK